MRLIDVDLYCATICKCNRRQCDKAKCPIHNAPTAYSVDGVVEELEKLADENYKAYCIAFNSDDRAEYDAYTNAIEIVKQGSVSDDVCEWKYDKHFEFAKSKCGSMDTHRIEFKKLKYCPYCGKKIKIVGD